MITGTTQLLGVIGHPIRHSLSPVMHNAAIAHLRADAVYIPLPVKPEDLQRAIAGFAAIGLQGFNVTIPYKQTILPFLIEISDLAEAVGAVNTVTWTERGWVGTNTDIAGFIAPLQQHCQNWQEKTAVVLGNGGSARAVVAGCAQLQISKIHVLGRNPEKLQAFQNSWQDSPLMKNSVLAVHSWETLPTWIASADLLVNTTPIGMHPHSEHSPLSALELKELAVGAIAYDLIYTPRPTRFLQLAEKQGAIALDGLEMLVQQGAAALQLWLHQPAPVDVMRRSLLEFLDRV